MDIDPSDTLQYRSAREHDDERHICPLQLGVIRRCVDLWSNPGDIVLDPFSGSGTTAKAAKELERQYIGFEINPAYCNIGEARTAQEVLSFAPKEAAK